MQNGDTVGTAQQLLEGVDATLLATSEVLALGNSLLLFLVDLQECFLLAAGTPDLLRLHCLRAEEDGVTLTQVGDGRHGCEVVLSRGLLHQMSQ